MRTARDIWPKKTPWHLHNVTGYSVRACEYWLEGRSPPPSDALALLLRSQWGREFLSAIMVGSRSRWWSRLISYFAALDAMSLQRIARKRLKEAIDADQEISASIARADAMLVQDEDFYSPHADAVRAMAGPSHRALAAPGTGRRLR